MQIDKFEKAAQRVLINGQAIAKTKHSLAFEPEHLVLALIMTVELRPLLRKKNIEYNELESALLNLISSLPLAKEGRGAFSGRLVQALSAAEAYSIARAHEKIGLNDLFLSIIENKDQFGALGSVLAKYFLRADKNLDPNSILFKVTQNINELVKSRKIDAVVQMPEVCERIIQVLSRKSRNNPILIGESGVGRTSIVYGLTQRIIEQKIPSYLVGKEILSLNIASLVAGTTLRGQFEEKASSLLKDLSSQQGQYILLVQDLAMLMGAGGEGSGDAVNLFKPALERGDIQLIGLVTPDSYKKRIESDPAFERLFQAIWLEPPSPEQAFVILKGIKERYELFHGVFIENEALKAAIDLGAKHLGGRVLPEVAIDLLDEAASRCRINIDNTPKIISDKKELLKQYELQKELSKNKQDNKKINILKSQINILLTNYEKELDIIESMRAIKSELYQVNLQLVHEKNIGDIKKAAELEGVHAKALIEQFVIRKKELLSIKKSARLIEPWLRPDHIAEIVSEQTGIPAQKMLQSEREKLLNMEDRLREHVIGQEEAISAVSHAIRRGRAGLSDAKKPIGSFLFLGPTGVGKTETARTLTNFLFDDEKAMHRFDMSEFMERHSVARLIGAPPGYQGSDEGGQLTEKVRRKPYSVVLFDEIEKAHVDVLNILLQVLDEGRLSDSRGNLINFSNTVIIMTSNIGADLLLKNAPRADLMERLLKHLRPEFINRIDEVVIFNTIARKDILKIAELMLNGVVKRMQKQGFSLLIDAEVKEQLAELGYSPEFGARPLRRTIQRLIENPLSMALVKGELEHHKVVKLSLDADKNICFSYAKTI